MLGLAHAMVCVAGTVDCQLPVASCPWHLPLLHFPVCVSLSLSLFFSLSIAFSPLELLSVSGPCGLRLVSSRLVSLLLLPHDHDATHACAQTCTA